MPWRKRKRLRVVTLEVYPTVRRAHESFAPNRGVFAPLKSMVTVVTMHVQDLRFYDLYSIDGSGYAYEVTCVLRTYDPGGLSCAWTVDFTAFGFGKKTLDTITFSSLDGELHSVRPMGSRATVLTIPFRTSDWTCPAPGCRSVLHADEASCWKCGGKKP